MVTIDEIKELKQHYTERLYKPVRYEQEIDKEYCEDAFAVPEVKTPHKIYRLGTGPKVVDAPADQIVTSNPQAFFDALKDTKGSKDAIERIGKLVNESWIPLLRRQNPNPFKESVKNPLARGETFIQLVHNENWVSRSIGKGKDGSPIFNRTGLPVHFLVPEPMVIYASPEEDNCGWTPNSGVPNRVIISYERQLQDVITSYPYWTNPKRTELGAEVEFWGYIDKDVIYYEADGEALTKGIPKNIYGFTPFVRKYSGFGRRSPDGDLSKLIVSDIRYLRDLLREECALNSDIASILHTFSQRAKIIMSPGPLSEEELTDIKSGEYATYVLSNVPKGTEFKFDEVLQPSGETYQHLANVTTRIAQRCPFITAGFPLGTSGRQDVEAYTAAMRRYDSIVESTESAFATAIEMALKICDVVPTLRPEGLQRADLKTAYKCEVKLRASDPIEEDNKITLGDRLWNMGNGSIDLETFHTQFQGRTQAESKRIKAKIMAEKLTLYSPDVASVLAMVFGEESGLQGLLEQAQQGRQMLEQGGLQQPPATTTTERVKGEIQTQAGREMTSEHLRNRGARNPPTRYTRG